MAVVKRPCDRCGTEYEAKRKTSKYCSASCRSAASRNRPPAEEPAAPAAPAAPTGPRTNVEQMVRKQLEERDRLDTVDGQAAVALAIQIDDRAGNLPNLIESLRETVQLALDSGRPAPTEPSDDGEPPDPITSLEERREQRRRSATA